MGGSGSWLIQQSCLPLVRVLRTMEDCVDHDAFVLDLIEDNEGESSDKSPAVIGEHGRIHQGMSFDGDDCRFNAPQELQTLIRDSVLVPGKGVGNVLPGRGEKVRLFSPGTQGSTS